MIDRNNLQAGHWTDDTAQRENFFTKIESRIVSESKFISGWYNVKADQEDIASEIRTEVLQQMSDKRSPFAEASLKKAADFYLENENFWIRERARLLARKIGRYQRKQAEILADVFQQDLPLDIEAELRTIAASIPRIESKIPDFTSGDHKIFGKEVLRRVGIDDLSTRTFEEVVGLAGVSASEQREYNKYHDEHGKNSPSDRKAWSRAHAKVEKVFPEEKRERRAKLTSLLGIVLFLSIALLTSINQKVADHQKDFVSQKPVYLLARLEGHQ